MNFLNSIFGFGSRCHEYRSTEGEFSVIAVKDIKASNIDKEKVEGTLDLRTDHFIGSWSEASFQGEYCCRHKNFFLGRAFTLSDKKASFWGITQKTDELFYEVYRDVPDNWEQEPHVYEDSREIDSFHEFCRTCNIGRVVFPPTSTKDK